MQESEDDLWASIALPVTMNSAEGQQVEYLVLDTDGMLVEPAVETYLQRLQQERDSEAAALQGAEERGEGADDAWALDPTLLKRMAAVRDAERGQIVQVRFVFWGIACVLCDRLLCVQIVQALSVEGPRAWFDCVDLQKWQQVGMGQLGVLRKASSFSVCPNPFLLIPSLSPFIFTKHTHICGPTRRL